MGLNGGRNGPSPNSSPSHTHSTNHCWGSTAPSNNSSGFHKAGFTQKPWGGDSLASSSRHKQKESRAEPDAEGHTLDLSMTANMDTLRQRLIYALRNRASQGGGRDLEYHG